MANLHNFDARNVAPREDFQILPDGEYTALITESAMKDTKTPGGQYLELTHEIIDPPQFKGRKVWARLNLVNSNSKTVEIAQRDLSAICHAVGVLQVNDSVQLHNKPLRIRVEVEKADDSKGRSKDQNAIKAWKAIGGAVPTAGTTGAQPAASNSSNVPAWARPAA